MQRNNTSLFTAVVLVAAVGACSSMTPGENGAAIGAGTGALVGGAVTGGSTLGTLGGAAVGAVIGHEVARR